MDAGPTGPAARQRSEPELNYDREELLLLLERAGLQPLERLVPAPSFSLVSLDSGRVEYESYLGRFVFFNFWATWCAPCVWEMPALQAVHDELSDEGLIVVGINNREREEEVREFRNEQDLTFPILLDRSGVVQEGYSVWSYPSSYLVSPEGIVLGGRIGPEEWDSDQILNALREIMALVEGGE
jgi:thiol-disulfide isomerase/thioredoxin